MRQHASAYHHTHTHTHTHIEKEKKVVQLRSPAAAVVAAHSRCSTTESRAVDLEHNSDDYLSCATAFPGYSIFPLSTSLSDQPPIELFTFHPFKNNEILFPSQMIVPTVLSRTSIQLHCRFNIIFFIFKK